MIENVLLAGLRGFIFAGLVYSIYVFFKFLIKKLSKAVYTKDKKEDFDLKNKKKD